jgi:hypothetical protein
LSELPEIPRIKREVDVAPSKSRPRVRVTNSSDQEVRVYVEPWGSDFPVLPNSWLDFEAERASIDFCFDVTHHGLDQHHAGLQSIAVRYEGNCLAIVALSPDGHRERFSWELPT